MVRTEHLERERERERERDCVTRKVLHKRVPDRKRERNDSVKKDEGAVSLLGDGGGLCRKGLEREREGACLREEEGGGEKGY